MAHIRSWIAVSPMLGLRASQANSVNLIHTTSRLSGKPFGDDPIKNTEDFKWPNQITTFEHYRLPKALLEHEFDYPVCRDTMGIRWPGYWFRKKFVYVQEMEPELVVPDLEGFDLKPYVSYRTDDVNVPPHSAKELFDAIYAKPIIDAYNETGQETYQVDDEAIDAARLKAMQTGADLFEENPTDGVRAPMDYKVDIN